MIWIFVATGRGAKFLLLDYTVTADTLPFRRLDPDLVFVKRYIFADDIHAIDTRPGRIQNRLTHSWSS